MARPRELVTSICTLDDSSYNAQVQQEINEELFTLLETGGGGDTYKVAVDLANLATPNYLNDQMYYLVADGDLGTYPDAAAPVVADVLSAKERYQVDYTLVGGFSGTGDYVLLMSDGVLGWNTFAGVADTFKFKISSGDNVEGYFQESMYLNAGYADGADLQVASKIEVMEGTNEKARLFVDVSTISGWHESDFRVLGIEGNVSTYFTAEDLAGEITPFIDIGDIPDTYRLVMGTVASDTAANSTTFSINTIVQLAGSIAPGSDPLTITNTIKQNFAAGEQLLAAYDNDSDLWRTVPVERFRSLRGVWDSGTSTLQVKNIVVLCSGRDPRSDPTSTTEAVAVENIHSDSYTTADIVTADYNVKDERWEARKKGGTSEINLQFGRTTSTIGAASGWTLAEAGTGTFLPLDDEGNGLDEQTIKNRYFDAVPDNIPGFVLNGTWVGINFGCRPGPND